jgi:DNA-binding response OmpR family regulator
MDDHNILLALSNAKEIRIFKDFLSSQGFEVTIATDGGAALEVAIGTPPALVITDPALPVISGERVFQIIRHNPNTKGVPFLFISDSVLDIKGFHTGVDVFLLRPLNLEEVRARITRALRTGALPVVAKSTDIEGRLSHISVPDILQFLHLNAKEGELLISSGATTGKVYVKDGNIYNSVTGGVEKEKALFRLLTLEEGKFEFIPRQISMPRKVKGSTGAVLMEGMRQIDEYRKHRDKLPDPDERVALAPDATEPAADLIKPVYHELAALLERYSMVSDIVEHCSWPDFEVLSAISLMIDRGVVVTGHIDTTESLHAGRPVISAVDLNGELVIEGGGHHPLPDAGGGCYPGPWNAGNDAVEFLTTDQAISIREKIITRFADTVNLTFARILIISTTEAAACAFLRSLKRIDGITVDLGGASLDNGSPNPVGEVATYRLYGGMELVFFSAPSVKDMGPVYTAFSSNLVGAILLFDASGIRELKDLAAAKHEVTLASMAPIAHIYVGEKPGDEDTAFFRKSLDLKVDEPLFTIDGPNGDKARDAVYSIFSKLLKEDYSFN